MLSLFSQLRDKEVIDICSGLRLGFICDAELDVKEGRITALITPGKPKFFGLLGREDDYVFTWDNIARVGADIILVELKQEPRRRKHPGRGW